MSTPTINGLGERIDLQLTQGANFGPILATMTNPAPPDGDGLAVNLTLCTIFGSIRKTPGAAAVAAAMRCVVTDAVNGKYKFELTGADTDAIPAGALLSSLESQYVWDLFLKDSLGRVTPLYYGNVGVRRRVTHPTP